MANVKGSATLLLGAVLLVVVIFSVPASGDKVVYPVKPIYPAEGGVRYGDYVYVVRDVPEIPDVLYVSRDYLYIVWGPGVWVYRITADALHPSHPFSLEADLSDLSAYGDLAAAADMNGNIYMYSPEWRLIKLGSYAGGTRTAVVDTVEGTVAVFFVPATEISNASILGYRFDHEGPTPLYNLTVPEIGSVSAADVAGGYVVVAGSWSTGGWFLATVDPLTGRFVDVYGLTTQVIDLSTHGDLVALILTSSSVYVFRVVNGTLSYLWSATPIVTPPLDVEINSRYVALATAPGIVEVWDVETAQPTYADYSASAQDVALLADRYAWWGNGYGEDRIEESYLIEVNVETPLGPPEEAWILIGNYIIPAPGPILIPKSEEVAKIVVEARIGDALFKGSQIVRLTGNIRVTIEASERLEGKVRIDAVDVFSGERITGATITLVDTLTGEKYTARPGVEESLPSGTYNVTIAAPNYQPITVQVTVASGMTADYSFALNPAYATVVVETKGIKPWPPFIDKGFDVTVDAGQIAFFGTGGRATGQLPMGLVSFTVRAEEYLPLIPAKIPVYEAKVVSATIDTPSERFAITLYPTKEAIIFYTILWAVIITAAWYAVRLVRRWLVQRATRRKTLLDQLFAE